VLFLLTNLLQTQIIVTKINYVTSRERSLMCTRQSLISFTVVARGARETPFISPPPSPRPRRDTTDFFGTLHNTKYTIRHHYATRPLHFHRPPPPLCRARARHATRPYLKHNTRCVNATHCSHTPFNQSINQGPPHRATRARISHIPARPPQATGHNGQQTLRREANNTHRN